MTTAAPADPQPGPEVAPVEDSAWWCPLCRVGGACVAGDEDIAVLVHLLAHRR